MSDIEIEPNYESDSFGSPSPRSSTTSSSVPPPPIKNPAPILIGTTNIEGFSASTLINTGASHNFVSDSFVDAIGLPTVTIDQPFMISTPLGVLGVPNRIGEGMLSLLHEDLETEFDMIIPLKVFPNKDFDLVLGMEWMQQVGLMIDMETRRIGVRTSPTTRAWFQMK